MPSDRGDLQDAFEQMSDRERARLRKKNVQSVTHTSTITTVKDVNLYRNLVEVYLGILGLTKRPSVELKNCSD